MTAAVMWMLHFCFGVVQFFNDGYVAGEKVSM